MITIKNNLIKLFLGLSLIISFSSCDETGDSDPGGTALESMAGEWYVQTFVGDNMVIDYQAISTYNTASNSTTAMWVDDQGHIWDFKAKSPVNFDNLTFSGTDLESSVEDDDDSTPDVIETYDITVSITNGQVTKGDTETSGGNMTDGISFDIEFSDDDDPGTVYTIKGYKKTGFLEDEH